ncbi:hypothetical protein DLM45_11275 [Hyphomicrobium methylovorum]|uniref:outer membrane beta-barrel protein n=1 Tax=Hyphomicrobium methylovorum TaxID=84 RepID=UPI0015E69163|nr:outer membrane beta-barrel protein [Hyphomicrobium methylovorum]MBA2126794.1 hypothetical protein [Hyphomicrobium methylovorum]
MGDRRFYASFSTLLVSLAALSLVGAGASAAKPASARYIPTDPSEAGQTWRDGGEGGYGFVPVLPDGVSPEEGETTTEPIEDDSDLYDTLQNGDASGGAVPARGQDGDVDSAERAAPVDGIDTPVLDMPGTGAVSNFDNRPAAPDPLLYQIENLDPIYDNRSVRRLFRQEPYDPVGIKVGSFVLFPELELGTSYYSNVFHTTPARSDMALDVNPSARLVSNWSRHALEFNGRGTLSFYDTYVSEDDRDYALEARGRLDITRRANIQALIARQQSFEDRSALDASTVGSRAKILVDRAEASYNQRFNRLSLQIRGSVTDNSYGDTDIANTEFNNRDRDFTQFEEAGRATWELKPSLSPFIEVANNHRDYAEVAQTDFINRTSNGQRYRVGISFGDTGEIIRGEISLGYGVQRPVDNRLHAVDGLIIDANATWRVTPLTSLLFTANSDVSETITSGVGGAFYRSAGIELRHQLRSYLVASAGFRYSNQDSQDGVINDNEFRETIGLEYFADRNTVLFGRYSHVNFDGIGIPSDYTGDEIHVGIRLRR